MFDDDAILPDDYEATPAPEQEVEQEQPAETLTEVEDTKPTEEEAEPTQEPQKLKIKYNHEEKEISLEEATTLAQKGLNYDKGIERVRQEAAQQARDAWIAEQGYAWNGKPITTEAEYNRQRLKRNSWISTKTKACPMRWLRSLWKIGSSANSIKRSKRNSNPNSERTTNTTSLSLSSRTLTPRPLSLKHGKGLQTVCRSNTPIWSKSVRIS
ncbi:hypothetical protein SD71_10750 [Cohnella kolymensis]|uniref:Uncharacterized protein n=1 Tax=Cohnella kolymensis TaxID=1590652 RepID=A0ABR5A487_9BACL|nr:hypothetical protein [Cohnella kolymensis]KIL35863.1 hypothetical protein SD71_10750 [Cohnella kolymensis]